MKFSHLSKFILGAAVALSIPLAAQTETTVAEDAANEKSVPESSGLGDATDFSTFSSEQMKKHSDKEIAEMQESLGRIVGLQQVARQQKDIIKLNCVNDKLLQIKQLMNIGDDSRTSLVEAIAQGDSESAAHYSSQIEIVSGKVALLNDEAEACVGEDMAFLGDTEVTVEGNGNPDDPTFGSEGSTVDDPHGDRTIERPAYSSPFL